jgi:hypothetical protein
MGFVIKKFSLQAIKEIIAKEKIAPSLFWVIPLGKGWKESDLFSIYNRFNNIDDLNLRSLCHLFVKGDPNSELKLSNSNPNISANGFNINNNGAVSNSFDGINKLLEPYEKSPQKSLIFICSNFDLPGWALTFNVDMISIDQVFDNLIIVLKRGEYQNLISLTQEVSESFENLEKARSKMSKFQGAKKFEIINNLERDIYTFCEHFNSLNQLKSIISNSDKLNLGPSIIEVLTKYSAYVTLHNFKNEVIYLIQNYRQLILDRKFSDLLSLVDVQLKSIANSFKYIPYDKVDYFVNNYEEWIILSRTEIQTYFINLFSKVQEFDKKRESEHDFFYPDYIRKSELFIQEIIDISPKMLIDLEIILKDYAKIISWDLPRMVGWKMSLLSEQSVTIGDFVESLNELFPESKIELEYDDEDFILNGDYFTDYFHHFLLENTAFFNDKRKLAEKMIGCFQPSYRKSVLRTLCSDKIEEYKDKSKLLTLLGWDQDPSYKNTISLISFFTLENGEYVITNPKHNTWNDLRKCLESYLTDITAIIKSYLIDDNDQIQNLVRRVHPDFTLKGNSNKSGASVLMSGTSALMIEALGPQWRADYDWGTFIQKINKIKEILNTNNHWEEDVKREEVIALELNPLFNDIFILTKDLFKVMPLHFRPISSHLCDLYSGEAWSHDLAEKKQLRIIIKEMDFDFKSNKEMIIWNPSKINPTVVKYKILK